MPFLLLQSQCAGLSTFSTLIVSELTSSFTPSSPSLVNFGTLCLLLFFPLSYSLKSLKRAVSTQLRNYNCLPLCNFSNTYFREWQLIVFYFVINFLYS